MADHITITEADGTWVVRAGGAVLGESENALELSEGDYDPVIYFPRGDIAMDFLDQTDKVTTCPWKGEAQHFSISTSGSMLENSAWSYETPKPEVAAIAGHIAFYNGDELAVEKL